jgi:hypothetical protein
MAHQMGMFGMLLEELVQRVFSWICRSQDLVRFGAVCRRFKAILFSSAKVIFVKDNDQKHLSVRGFCSNRQWILQKVVERMWLNVLHGEEDGKLLCVQSALILMSQTLKTLALCIGTPLVVAKADHPARLFSWEVLMSIISKCHEMKRLYIVTDRSFELARELSAIGSLKKQKKLT